PVLVSGPDGRRVTGQSVDAGEEWRGGAGAAHRHPAAPLLVVDRDVPRNRRDIGRGTACAGVVMLPGWLRRVGRAAAPSGASEKDVPHSLSPAAVASGAVQDGAADRGHVVQVGWETGRGESDIARRGRDDVTWVAVGAGELLGEAVLSRAVAVADDLRAQ